MTPHEIVSQKEWLVARKALLMKEKELTKLRDQLSEERRALPWVKVEKSYVFDAPEGKMTLGECLWVFQFHHIFLILVFVILLLKTIWRELTVWHVPLINCDHKGEVMKGVMPITMNIRVCTTGCRYDILPIRAPYYRYISIRQLTKLM